MHYFTRISLGYYIRIASLSLILFASIPWVYAQPTKKGVTPTSAGSVIRPDSIAVRSAATIQDLLYGADAGMYVAAAGHAPDAAFNTMIRGINFSKGSNQPLFILDGVMLNPVHFTAQNAYWNDPTDYQMVLNSLSAIHPADIETVEVLRDAASTAIYGSLGANGVVRINTKMGRSPKTTLYWHSSLGISTSSNKIDVLSPENYLNYMRDKSIGMPSFNPQNTVDWQDASTRTGWLQNHYLSVSGLARNDVSYSVSFGYRNEQGIIDRSGFTGGNLRLNIDIPVSRYGRVGTRMLFVNSTTDMTSGTAFVDQTSAMTLLTLGIPYQDAAVYGATVPMESPKSVIADYDDKTMQNRFIPYFYAEAEPFKWMRLRSSFGFDYRDLKRQRWTGNGVAKSMTVGELNKLPDGSFTGGMVGRSDMLGMVYNFDNSITLTKNSDSYKLEGLIGYSIRGTNIYDKISEGYNVSPAAHVLRAKGISSAATYFTANYMPTRYSISSAYAQASFLWKDKYFLTAGVRSDYNTTYTEQYQWYPSISAAWDVYKESFMSGIDVLSLLKVRGGWGRSGVWEISPYRYASRYIGSDYFQPTVDIDPKERPVTTFGINRYGFTQECNLGFDVAFLQNRIKFSADFFTRESTENLEAMYTPYAATESTVSWKTRSIIENRGMEFSLNAIPVQGDITWKIGATMAFIEGNVKFADDLRSDFWWGNSVGNLDGRATPANVFMMRRSPAAFYGLRTQGVMQREHETYAPKYRGKRLYAGDIKFIDLTGDGNVDNDDRTVIGNPIPKFTYSLGSSVTWRQWTFGLDLYGTYGNDICNLNLLNENNVSGTASTNVRVDAYHQAWKPTATATDFPKLGAQGLNEVTNRLIEDGSFLRIANVSLNYRLPVMNVKWVQHLDLGVRAVNLFTFTKYSGYDPEVDSFAGDVTRYGLDHGSYPAARSFIFSISTTF